MKHNARQAIAKAVLETLEGRAYMSASIALQDGVLHLRADPNTASTMQVQYTADHNYIRAYSNIVARTYRADQVTSLDITGSNKSDDIYVDPRLGLPAKINGEAGNDVIKGGAGLDTIDGGSGNDAIYGHGSLSAGTGNTTIWGSNRGDVIYGGPGNDLLIGGSGNNTIYGGTGDSTLIAGQGNDRLVAGTGDQVLYGANGRDTLVGGPGADTLYGGAGPNVIVSGSNHTEIHSRKHNVIQNGTGSSSGPVVTPPVKAPPPVVKAPPPVVTPPVVAPPVSQPPVVHSPPPVQPPVVNTGGPTQAIIDKKESTVLAGEGVEVNGLNSVLHAGDRLTATYQWNFGDTGSKYNDLTGWNAGHVYDHAGTYQINLTVTDASGRTSTATSEIQVGSDNRPIIYVDTNGSDSNSGASPNQAVQTAVQAFQLAGSNTRIEFHRGETFTVNQTLHINGQDMYVGAYGSGANPVISRGKGDGIVTLFLSNKSSNTTIEGLTFDSPNAVTSGAAPKIGVDAVWAEGANIVVRNNMFLNVDDAINGSMQPSGMIVQDNVAPLTTGIRAYFTWVDGTDWTIVGNTVANSTREHIIRGNSMTLDRVLIADNHIANITRSDDATEIPKCNINFRAGRDIYISENTIDTGMIGMGPGPWSDPANETAWVKVDGNILHGAQVYLAGAVHHALVVDNVLDMQGSSQIHLRPGDPDYPTRHMSDVTITGNTGINNSAQGQFLEVTGEDTPGQITVTNNLYAAPNLATGQNMSGGMLVTAPDLNDFALISGNVWPAGGAAAGGGVNYVHGTWFADAWETPQQWNNESVVQNDSFRDVTLPAGTTQMSFNGVTVGAVMSKAA